MGRIEWINKNDFKYLVFVLNCEQKFLRKTKQPKQSSKQKKKKKLSRVQSVVTITIANSVHYVVISYIYRKRYTQLIIIDAVFHAHGYELRSEETPVSFFAISAKKNL